VDLFLSGLTFARIAITDKIIGLYQIGLKILDMSMKEPICGPHISAKTIVKEANQLAIHLLSKVEELNYKTRKDTQRALLTLFKH